MTRALFYLCILMAGLCASATLSAADDTTLIQSSPLTFDSALPASGAPLTLLRITPEGEDVAAGRQIVFQFDRPVVPVGRMERAGDKIPIHITPSVECQWRWIDTSALACQLTAQKALKPATRYTVRVDAGIRTADGAVMSEAVTHRFITQRPKITYTHFQEWRAPGRPRIQLTFNQAVTRASVEKHVRFFPAGGASKDFGLVVTPAENDRWPVLYAPLPGEPYGVVPEYASKDVDERQSEQRGQEARRVWVVAPQQDLPADSDIFLTTQPGLVSALGPAPGVDSRTVVEFRTYPPFRFLGIECTEAATRSVRLLAPDFRSHDPLPESMARCLPLHPVSLVFSAPVINAEVKAHLRFSPDLAAGRTDYDPWANAYGYSHLRYPHGQGRTYRVRLPETLKAFQRYEVIGDQVGVRDEFGRPLARPVDMAFLTAHRPPRLVLDHRKAVLEKQVDTDVPVIVTNLKSVEAEYRAVTTVGETDVTVHRKPVAEVQDLSFAMPLGVRAMLGNRSGAVTGRLDSRPRVDNYNPGRYRFFAQVTPFQVHVKLGHFNSLVWITDLATGEPVENARLAVYVDDYGLHKAAEQAQSPPEPQGTLASAVSNSDGIAYLPGINSLDPNLNLLQYYWRDDRPRLFIRIRRGEDLALVPLDGNFMTRAGRTGSSNRPTDGHLHAWGTTAQGVYKVGDRIQYKFYVRNQSNRHWVAPPSGDYALKVIDPKGETVAEIETLKLSPFGAYSGEIELSAQAAVGWYRFQLVYSGLEHQTLEPLRVLVSDFTPSPFRVTAELNASQFAPGDDIEVTTRAALHAGGPYARAQTRTTARLRQERFHSQDAAARRFTFETHGRLRPEILLHQSSQTGDDRGTVSARFALADQEIYFGRLAVEGAVRDDRGKFVAARSSARYHGRDRYVGLRNTAWTYAEDTPAVIEYLVVDRNGAPVAGTPVRIAIERQEVKASRVKGAGNAYLTQYIQTWVAAGQCDGISGDQAQACTFTPSEPGSYRFTATIADTQNRPQSSQIGAWVVGKGRVLWREPNGHSLQIVPEEDNYEVGDIARFLIKNPFPGAEALITVERYGVLKHWTQTLESGTPVLEIPVAADYLPGFYLSVLVNSPRVDQPPGTGEVDLGKPTFRLGYVKVAVKDDTKKIALRIETDRAVYKPRATVKARIQALPPHGAQEQPLEFAAVVIDEAVFDLNTRGRDYYDPYQGFNRLDPLDLNNYSLLTRLVGRQKFAKKGANPGGGGAQGGPALRNLFKFVSYWNPSIEPDQNGCADIEFDLPDNLTGWRIFALAVTPDDRMGLGEANIKVNQPTELRPVMPNQVTGGDSFRAGFSVMNRTGNVRTLAVKITAAGALDPSSADGSTVDVTLGPYQRQSVWLAIKTKGAGEIGFWARAGDAHDGDAIEHHLPVNPRRSLVTAADYGTTTRSRVSLAVAFPDEIRPDAGGLSVAVSPSVIGAVDGALAYARDYPYACWEQQLTRAVMASHANSLGAYLPDDFAWENSPTLPRTLIERAASFQAPGGGMAYWIPEDRYVSPYLSAYTGLAFNWLRKSGVSIPAGVESKLHAYLEKFLRRDVLPTFFSPGMASSVRAVALAVLAEHGKIDAAELLRYESHLPEMDLFGKAHFLQAASAVDAGRPSAARTAKLILGHASQSGGKFQFNESWDDNYRHILATPLRSNCAILSSLMGFGDSDETLALVGDVPFKQVRAITRARGTRDHWQNTQENVFCLNALTDYARVYEKEKPDMTVTVALGAKTLGETLFTEMSAGAVTFEDPMTPADPDKKTEVNITKSGPGRLYYSTRLRYAPSAATAERIVAGMQIRREYSVERDGTWTLLKPPLHIRRGELVRADIYLSVPTRGHFVVVDDPIPGGLEPVNRDLATASGVDGAKGEFKPAAGAFWFDRSGWSDYGGYGASFYHQELRHHAVRFYADTLPAGDYHLSYSAQAIAVGEFFVLPVLAAEMYDPDVSGKGLPQTLTVLEQ